MAVTVEARRARGMAGPRATRGPMTMGPDVRVEAARPITACGAPNRVMVLIVEVWREEQPVWALERVETEKVVACKVPVVTRVPFRVERIRVETERAVAARVVRVAVELNVDAVASPEGSARMRVEPAKVEVRSGAVLRVLRLAAVVMREERMRDETMVLRELRVVVEMDETLAEEVVTVVAVRREETLIVEPWRAVSIVDPMG